MKRGFFAIIGSVLYSVGIALFLDPNGLAPGGLVGVSMILTRLLAGAGITFLTTGVLYFIFNIPIMLLGIWKLGVKFMATTFLVVTMNSCLMNLLSGVPAVTTDWLIASIAGGAMVGSGLGFIFLSGTTSGGMDIIIKLIKKKRPHMKTGFLFMAIDLTVVSLSGILFHDINLAMYAAIAVFVSGRAMNYILYGSDEARLIYIVSNKYEEMAQMIMKNLDTGITLLEGTGAYTGEHKQVIMCVLQKNMVPKLENIIKDVDYNSFMIVTSANEIYGEGYKNILATRL